RPRHRRPHPTAAAVPRRHLDPGARPRQRPAAAGRDRRLGGGAGGPDAGRRVLDVARTLARGTAPSSPLNATVSRNRRFTVASGKLDDYRTVRARYDCDVNDVVLAVVAGALSNWLMSRGETVAQSTTIRAMAPLSVYADDQ